jgi:AbrB family looped-hinge helix DNA binding protein
VSAKGNVSLPKAIRNRRGWTAGVELIVEDRPDGVLFRAATSIGGTKVEDVFGCLGSIRASSMRRQGAIASRSVIATDTGVVVRCLVAAQPLGRAIARVGGRELR